MSSLKNNKEEYGPDCTVSNTKLSSVTLNELAIKVRERILQNSLLTGLYIFFVFALKQKSLVPVNA